MWLAEGLRIYRIDLAGRSRQSQVWPPSTPGTATTTSPTQHRLGGQLDAVAVPCGTASPSRSQCQAPRRRLWLNAIVRALPGCDWPHAIWWTLSIGGRSARQRGRPAGRRPVTATRVCSYSGAMSPNIAIAPATKAAPPTSPATAMPSDPRRKPRLTPVRNELGDGGYIRLTLRRRWDILPWETMLRAEQCCHLLADRTAFRSDLSAGRRLAHFLFALRRLSVVLAHLPWLDSQMFAVSRGREMWCGYPA